MGGFLVLPIMPTWRERSIRLIGGVDRELCFAHPRLSSSFFYISGRVWPQEEQITFVFICRISRRVGGSLSSTPSESKSITAMMWKRNESECPCYVMRKVILIRGRQGGRWEAERVSRFRKVNGTVWSLSCLFSSSFSSFSVKKAECIKTTFEQNFSQEEKQTLLLSLQLYHIVVSYHLNKLKV